LLCNISLLKCHLYILQFYVTQCITIKSKFLNIFLTWTKYPPNSRCVHSVYSATCLGLSKFAKLARSVTRTKQTFSSTLIPSQAPVKAGLNVTEVKLVRGREGMTAWSLNACTLNLHNLSYVCLPDIFNILAAPLHMEF